jgi:hypothetical protein
MKEFTVNFDLQLDMTQPFKEEVLGKRCDVMFLVGRSNKEKPFAGRITAYKAELEGDNNGGGRIVYEHHVVFDDGDELWLDLIIEQNAGRLRWHEPISAAFGDGRVAHDPQQRQRGTRTPRKSRAPNQALLVTPMPGYIFPEEQASIIAPQQVKSAPDQVKSAPDQVTSTPDQVTSTPDHVKSTPYQVTSTPKQAPSAPPQRDGAAATASVTPERPVPIRIWLTPREDTPVAKRQRNGYGTIFDSWVEDMAEWLTTVPHGQNKRITSAANAASVMRQVKKLASGRGVGYTKWPEDKIFYENVKVDLTFDFDKMLDEAREYEFKYGEDSGHGWLLRHPIVKMKRFQESKRG